jgi:plasmid stability protein
MSTSIMIGEVPDEVREELAARAAVCGRSLEDYVRDELLALAKRPSAAVWMARVRARKDALQGQLSQEQLSQGQQLSRDQQFPRDRHCACGPSSSHAEDEPPSAPRASGSQLEPQRDVG